MLSIVSVGCHLQGPVGCLKVYMYSWHALVDLIELVLVKPMNTVE